MTKTSAVVDSDLERVMHQVRLTLVPVLGAAGWQWAEAPPSVVGGPVLRDADELDTACLRDVLAGLRRWGAR
ncbi:hypothetical protein QNO07_07170 [Streptomyces sp. 549]|uniref:hypothetical protein n=1 Tax=Streptomyces sp. 549 TaxID=3049076 RepID=UPI0024C3614F|nr:hypothetical protein [Streptomyces sp. 549]MDK1473204.1 hypothetical protein [Streptomyces sp. 549]